ncbi:XRE family transcriptional regulator [Pseudonocardia sp. EC080610-09]|uniref:helix-turn-helix domain-containing protein n=1 Tax=unclassified Pseudonocardia TaxID=2619320 RepID=UPI00070647EC|nr:MULTISPECIES: helix-turn-helix transcriptional regulator [unclassified Pseudonocardia]ALL78227.1 XRE family transcriptional regulator [Pseudonocardia sp. EC080610-09]ALL84425.1 XRE family transcriptional regulator [Pseudonocardia sp. EC080619-01]
MTDEPNTLGEYLRARRALVTPEQVGIPVLGTRRVPGLRREEVAMLAGISAEYYLRLEQGRDRRPSVQVLEAIARVLRLDDSSHLLGIATDTPRRKRSRARREALPPSTARLIDALPFPAFAEGRYLDVLAANPLAGAVSPRLVPGGNRLRDVFLDEAEQDLFEDWERAAAALLAGFRRTVGTSVDDPRVVELVGDLSLASPQFRRLWARHDIAERTGAALVLDHPSVGALRLDREKLAVSGTDGIMLVIYHAQPGTDSAERLALLGSVAAEATGDQRPTNANRRTI